MTGEQEMSYLQDFPKKDLLSVREVAQYLRVDETTVRRWIKKGVLKAVTLPFLGRKQKYRIERATIDALLGR